LIYYGGKFLSLIWVRLRLDCYSLGHMRIQPFPAKSKFLAVVIEYPDTEVLLKLESGRDS
ncbi:hypothetical protein N9Z55_10110, partial [Akkermansiaceae bacterium]|nr:hypothetical protein [Akkermansiaceae bacterium]